MELELRPGAVGIEVGGHGLQRHRYCGLPPDYSIWGIHSVIRANKIDLPGTISLYQTICPLFFFCPCPAPAADPDPEPDPCVPFPAPWLPVLFPAVLAFPFAKPTCATGGALSVGAEICRLRYAGRGGDVRRADEVWNDWDIGMDRDRLMWLSRGGSGIRDALAMGGPARISGVDARSCRVRVADMVVLAA